MTQRQKDLYYFAFNVTTIILMVSAAAMIFSHLRLEEFETLGGQASLIFSEDAQNEFDLMEDIRLISGALFLISLAITAAVGDKYYKLVPDTEWELKKGLATGTISAIIGIGVYYVSSDLFLESIGLALGLIGVISTVGGSIYLISFDGKKNTRSGGAESYCSKCGSEVSKSDSYCPDCGTEL